MSARPILVIANWKLNGSIDLISEFALKFSSAPPKIQMGVCPPYVYLDKASDTLKSCQIECGGQSISEFDSGAYTGEVSAQMIKDVGGSFCLVGHSERRTLFGETDESCNKKLKAAIARSVYAVLCVGESQEQRQSERTNEVIEKQLRGALKNIDFANTNICIAYEPVWAIGTGLSATPEMAQEVHLFIRHVLSELSTTDNANNINILYGGSVKKDTAKELMAKDDIDGLLVGGASLDADHFYHICKNAEKT